MDSPLFSERARNQKLVYASPYSKIYTLDVDFQGMTKEYFVHVYEPRVGLILLKDDSLLLTRQYRLMIDRVSWEIPGGSVDEGESFEEAIIRECREETGIECRDLKKLIYYHQSIDTLYTPTQIFYTDQFEEVSLFQSNPQEVLSFEWMKLIECERMIDEGVIVDSFSIIAIQSFLRHQSRQDK